MDLAFLDLEHSLDLVHSLDLKHLFMATDKVR